MVHNFPWAVDKTIKLACNYTRNARNQASTGSARPKKGRYDQMGPNRDGKLPNHCQYMKVASTYIRCVEVESLHSPEINPISHEDDVMWLVDWRTNCNKWSPSRLNHCVIRKDWKYDFWNYSLERHDTCVRNHQCIWDVRHNMPTSVPATSTVKFVGNCKNYLQPTSY